MPFQTKRTYSESSLSPPSSAEEDDGIRSPSPPRKRPFVSGSDPSTAQSASDGFSSLFMNGARKRPACDSDLEGDDCDLGISSDEQEITGQNPWSSDSPSGFSSGNLNSHPWKTSPFLGSRPEDGSSRQREQPLRKRTKRGLSEGFNQLGISEDLRTPLIEEEQPGFIHPSQQSAQQFAFPRAGNLGNNIGEVNNNEGDLQPSSVVEPGEVGPAVWLGHAQNDDASDGLRFTVLNEDGNEEPKLSRQSNQEDWKVGVWKGKNRDQGPGRLYVHPSYMNQHPSHSSYLPSSHPWDPNQPHKDMILYNPLNNSQKLLEPSSPTSSRSSFLSSNTPIDAMMDTELYSNPNGPSYQQDWFGNGPRFEEIADDEPSPEAGGGMDID
ncbi:hypothetical protein [Phaffia rhodozyma]|uniref:Uncharacterized protein n=1 Tax=Phaffia rhodozyma TaxID=264483 RepID=A0A0F7SNH6_PHARH|nr:hypothetical protein [Phaffia rhodozyma]